MRFTGQTHNVCPNSGKLLLVGVIGGRQDNVYGGDDGLAFFSLVLQCLQATFLDHCSVF